MTFPIPELPEGRTRCLPGRGEMFFRRSQGGRVGDPTVLLLHGWTASADTQFFSAYPALVSRYSFVAPDHRGHGRGMRARFTLEDVADDAAALVRSLGVGPVVTVGFSMGGPISMLSPTVTPTSSPG
ncbi:MAG: alpha/beta fold hydrolase [Ilumatobacteraceae bacterium]